MWEVLGNSVAYLAAAALLILVVYFAVRAGSVAFFRTKREYVKQSLEDLKEIGNGEDDGKDV